jgi:hypothetical protein
MCASWPELVRAPRDRHLQPWLKVPAANSKTPGGQAPRATIPDARAPHAPTQLPSAQNAAPQTEMAGVREMGLGRRRPAAGSMMPGSPSQDLVAGA